MKMKTVEVQVAYSGTVTVKVPASLSDENARLLGETVAVARIVATTDNPDGPEDAACQEYAKEAEQSDEQAEKDWDKCEITASGGNWNAVVAAVV